MGDERVKFCLYVQKCVRPSWMSASLLLRKLCSDTTVDRCHSLDDDVWSV